MPVTTADMTAAGITSIITTTLAPASMIIHAFCSNILVGLPSGGSGSRILELGAGN